MDSRLLTRLAAWALAITVALAAAFPAHAQWANPAGTQRHDWWRNGATLDLDFVNQRFMVSNTTPSAYTSLTTFNTAVGATFSRASNATYYDADGIIQTAPANTPRLDYETSGTGVLRGILIEEARTNLISMSVNYPSNSAIVAAQRGDFVSSTIAAPDGSINSVTKIVENTVNDIHGARWLFPYVSGTTYTISMFLKPNGRSVLTLLALDAGGTGIQTAAYNLVSGTATQTLNGLSGSQGIDAATNGFYRCWMSFKPPTGNTTQGYFDIRMSHVPNPGIIGDSYAGDGTSGMYVWGVQLEAGSNPTSYIRTTTAPAGRNADTFTIPTAAWYTASIGTLIGTGVVPTIGGAQFPGVASLDDGTVANAVDLLLTGTASRNTRMGLTVASAQTYTAIGNAYVPGQPVTMALAYQANDACAAADGLLLTCSSGVLSMPTINRLRIGFLRGGSHAWNGWVQRVTYFPIREPDYSLPDYTR